MSFQKRLAADFLFAIQIIGAFVFCGAFTLRALEDVTGSSLAQFGLVITFLLFHIALGIGAFKVNSDRGAKQAIATYVIWLVLILVLMAVTGYSSRLSSSVLDRFILWFEKQDGIATDNGSWRVKPSTN